MGVIDPVIKIVEVQGGSMLPNLKSGDLLLASNTRSDNLKPGQIILVKIYGKKIIKRLVGKPGDTVELVGGVLIANGRPVKEGFTRYTDKMDFLWELKDNEYLILGDNGRDSLDSRKIGPVESNAIIGRIFLKLWPLGRLIS